MQLKTMWSNVSPLSIEMADPLSHDLMILWRVFSICGINLVVLSKSIYVIGTFQLMNLADILLFHKYYFLFPFVKTLASIVST